MPVPILPRGEEDMQEKQPFEHYALVELFGHQRIAGKVTEAEIGGGKFLRVDVPALGELQALTRFYGPAAIYGITPVTEETALALAKRFGVQPVAAWDARQLLQPERTLAAGADEDEDDDDGDEEIDELT